MKIIGIDPGKHTGLVYFYNNELKQAKVAETYEEIVHFITRNDADYVIMESFQASRKVNYHDPIKVIGIVEYITDKIGYILITQPPSLMSRCSEEAKSYTKNRHLRAACAHVLYFMKKAEKNGLSKEKSQKDDIKRSRKKHTSG